MRKSMLGLLVALALGSGITHGDTGLKAGSAKANITPPLGLPLIGEWNNPDGVYVRDELYARCLVISSGETKVAFVVCDLLGISTRLSEKARKLAEEHTGIPAANILISATHNHRAPNALGVNRRLFDSPLTEYGEFVAQRVADAIACAAYTLRPAEVGWTSANAPEHVFNRRWYLKPETMPENPFGSKADKVKMNPGRLNPGLIRPAGPVDPQVSILAARTPEGEPIGVLANYSLHYVGDTIPGEVTADYYGAYNEHLAKLLGTQNQSPPFVSLMSNGTSGDINNWDVTRPTEKLPIYGKITHVGEDVAQKVFDAYQQIAWQKTLTIGVAFDKLKLKVRHPTTEELAWAKRIKADPEAGKTNRLAPIYAERALLLQDAPAEWNFPVQVFRIGELGICSFPCEVLAEIGLELKQKSPLQPAFTISLAHGYYGYLPTPAQHDLGGYETWLGTNKMERDASTKFVEHLIAMLGKLKN